MNENNLHINKSLARLMWLFIMIAFILLDVSSGQAQDDSPRFLSFADDETSISDIGGAIFSQDEASPHVWEFDGIENQMIQITATRIGGRFTPQIALVSPSGEDINPNRNSPNAPDDTFVFTDGLPETGRYHILVTASDVQPLPEFLVNEYSIMVQRMGFRRANPGEGLPAIPNLGQSPLPNYFADPSQLQPDLNVSIHGTDDVTHPDPNNQRNHWLIMGNVTVSVNNTNPIFRGITAMSFPSDGFAFRTSSDAVFFTNQNVINLEYLSSGVTNIQLESGQTIETDFYRIQEMIAVDDLIALRMVDGQRIILMGDSLSLLRRGGINGEGPNAEPINLITVDGTTIETDLSEWETLYISKDDDTHNLQVHYNKDMRLVADTISFDLLAHEVTGADDNQPLKTLVDIIYQGEENTLPITVDTVGMGDVVVNNGLLSIQPLVGDLAENPIADLDSITIEDHATQFALTDGSYRLFLPDGTIIETPSLIETNSDALPTEMGFIPRFYNNLGTHIFDYHPNINFTEALMPVNRVNRNFYYSVDDFAVSGDGINLQWSRHYNSLAPLAQTPAYYHSADTDYLLGTMGSRWRHSYQIELDVQYAPLGQVRMNLGDGGIYVFERTDSENRFRSQHLLSWTVEQHAGITGHWRAVTTEGIVYEFDRAGRLMSIADSLGRSIHFSPTPADYVARNSAFSGFFVIDNYGRRMEVYQNRNGEIIRVRDVQGRNFVYSYNEGLLSTVDYPSAVQSATYEYDDNNQLSIIQDTKSPYHEAMSIAYNEQGQVEEYRLNYDGADGQVFIADFEFEGTSGTSTIIETHSNALRNSEIIEYRWVSDNLYRLREWDAPKENWNTRWEYDLETQRLSEYIMPNQGRLRFNIDAVGYLTVLRDPNFTDMPYQLSYANRGMGMRVLTRVQYPRNGLFEAYEYDDLNRLVQVTRPFNANTEQVTKYEYNEQNQLEQVYQEEGAERIVLLEYQYDDFGYLSSVTERGEQITRFGYDVVGRLRSVEDADGRRSIILWDDERDIITGLDINVTDPENLVTVRYEYDVTGNLTRYFYQDAQQDFTYDELNNISSITQSSLRNELQRVETYGHDAFGNITSLSIREIEGNNSELVESLEFTYDEQGFLKSAIDSTGDETLYSVEASNSRVEYCVQTPTGEINSFVYGVLNRLNTYTNGRCGNSGTALFSYGFNYNTVGQLTNINRPQGEPSAIIEYDLFGNAVSTTLGNFTTDYAYDEWGRLVGIRNPENQTISYSYNEFGDVTQLVESGNDPHEFEYPDNEEFKYTTPDNNTYVYTLDSLGQVTAIENPDGGVTTYRYSPTGELVAMQNPLGEGISVTYDGLGRLIRLTDAVGNNTRLDYLYGDLVERITATENFPTTTIAYDTNGFVSSFDQPNERQQFFSHDPQGRLISYTNPPGHTTLYDYSNIGRVNSVTDPLGNQQLYTYLPSRQVSSLSFGENASPDFRYQYDSIGRLERIINPNGIDTRLQYDTAGNIIEIRFGTSIILNSDSAIIHRYTYDDSGRVATYTPPASTTSWQFSYTPDGLIASVIDPENNIAIYHYDSVGNITEIRRTLAENGAVTAGETTTGRIETYEYDAVGRVTRYVDPEGLSTEFSYNANGHLVSYRVGDGAETILDYDDFGNLIEYTDTQNNKVIYRHDAFRNIIEVQATDGQSGEDEDSSTTHTYEYQYDGLDNLTVITLPDEKTISFTYNVLSNRIRYIDATNNGWAYSYDSAENLSQISDPLGNTIEYEYDTANRLIAIAYASSNPVLYEYDNRNHISRVVLPRNVNQFEEIINYRHDANGNLVSINHDSNNDNVTFERDNLGRVTSLTYFSTEGTTATPITTNISYNELGLISTIQSDDISVEREYDDVGRLITTQTSDSQADLVVYTYDGSGNLSALTSTDISSSYTYDSVGNLTQRDMGNIGNIQYTYDSLSRPISATIGEHTVSISYDTNGRRERIEWDNGLTTRYRYDENGHVTSIVHTNADDEVIDEFAYDYDTTGNMTKVTHGDATSVRYSYDARQQLISETWLDESTQPVYTVNYQYDDVGNRVEQSVRVNQQKPIVVEFVYNNLNQLIEIHREVSAPIESLLLPVVFGLVGLLPVMWLVRRRQRLLPVALIIIPMSFPFFQQNTEDNVIITYTYDTTGTLTQEQGVGGHLRNYEYDSLNRLISITGTNTANETVLLQLTYDAQGRVSHIVTGDDTNSIEYQLVYDAFGLAAIRNLTDGSETAYLGIFPDEHLLSISDDEEQWFLHDGLGSVRRMANANAESITENRGFDISAFGELIMPFDDAVTGLDTQPMPLWLGQIYEPTTGTYTMGTRTYLPQIGRFIQRDPVRHDPTGSLYTYAHNRPTALSDSSGLTPSDGIDALSPDISNVDKGLEVSSPLLFEQPDITRVSVAQSLENRRMLQLAQMVQYDLNTTTGVTDSRFCDFYIQQVHPIPDRRQTLADNSFDAVISSFNVGDGWQTPHLPSIHHPPNSIEALEETIDLTQVIATHPLAGCDTPVALPHIPNPLRSHQPFIELMTFRDVLVDTQTYESVETELSTLLNIGEFPVVDALPVIEESVISVPIIPPFGDEVDRMMDETQALFESIMLPKTFGLQHDWRNLSQVYDLSQPIVRRVRLSND